MPWRNGGGSRMSALWRLIAGERPAQDEDFQRATDEALSRAREYNRRLELLDVRLEVLERRR